MANRHNETDSSSWLVEYLETTDFGDDPASMERLLEQALHDLRANATGNFEFTLGDISLSPQSGGYVHARSYIYGALLVVSLLVGLVMNVLLAWAVGRRSWSSCSHAGLRAAAINMSVSSISFLLFGMPLLLTENVFGYGWQLGHDVCQIHRYLTYATFYAMPSAALLLLVCAVATSLRPTTISRLRSARLVALVAAVLWGVILLTNIPNYLGHGVSDELPGVSYCYHKEMMKDRAVAQTWTTLQVLFNYFLPVLSMCALTALLLFGHRCKHTPTGLLYLHLPDDNRHNTNQLTLLALVVTAIFTLCWGPDKVLALLLVYHPRRMSTPLLITSDVFMVLGYSYPLVNSVVMLARFRDVISPKSNDVTFNRADYTNVCVPADGVRDDKMEVLECNLSSTV